MGKHPRRKFRRYIRGNIDDTQVLATLSGNTGLKFAVTGTVTEKAWCSSVKLFHSMTNYTPTVNVGPVTVWITHSDYTLTEVEEYIEALGSASWDEGDLRTREIMKRGRYIKMVGQYAPGDGDDASSTHVLNGGKPVTTKCGWMLTTGKTIAIVWYNSGSGGISGTSPLMQLVGHANLWPA